MKFTNGYWMNREEYQIDSPMEAYDAQKEGNSLKVFAPFKRVLSRGDQLNLGATTITLTSPIENVIGVKLEHFDSEDHGPSFKINNLNPKVDIQVKDKMASLESGDLKVSLPLNEDFLMKFTANNHLVTESVQKAQGVIYNRDKKQNYMCEQLSMGIDEKIYGLGERFGNFVKNGQSIDTWNQDGGTGSEQAYKNIPFYLSSNGYGVFVDEPQKVSFEVASENVDRVQFSTEGQSLQYYVIYGPTSKEVLHRYTQLTGKINLPPAWSFGLWLSTSFTTDYSEETVLKFIDGMKEHDIPLDVFHFDCFWQKGFEWCTLAWDKEQFPDPEGLLRKIHERGVKVCVWLNPYIAQKSPLFKEAKEKGYLIKRQNGDVWQWDLWQAGNGFIDFTNPAAKKWYKSKLKELLDMGVDCFKTDFGERIPIDDVQFYDGSNPQQEHNYYTLQYNQAVYDIIAEVKGKKEAVVFARSATVGSQSYPVHWGGDCLSNYNSMRDTLRGGLSFLVSGFGFWSHDIGGFEDGDDRPTPDLYKRWTQFGLLSSHSRYHGSNVYRVPWNFDQEAVENTRRYVNLKLSLMPYLYTQAAYDAKFGNPLMRPMFLEFEDDPNVSDLATQYMFGSQILVAPIFNDQGKAHFYLPGGKWTSLLDNKVYQAPESGEWLNDKFDELSLPVLVRENTILVRNEKAIHAEYDYTKNVDIHLYQIKEGTVSTNIVSSKGLEAASIRVQRKNQQIKVSTVGVKGKVRVYLHENEQIMQKGLIDNQVVFNLE
ncbi:alpha-glucosidase, family 31 of glycosyl hydrolase [Companilactobacillus paralimentarius DSM 13238 = JCM 10415]|uniref:alpha-D-xyloside xylohydrolase n=1 Tax=Companilactobacillus paralimentarius DSM 13238 = JCM 10415 TaxID=1122151 RepID=A0A0R1PFB5_9LACO|nr:alpha-xylosidase [Companilactobacillus paralimentarius]KAE9564623.1 alpha-xylosidase [Companilactobacillus paralimentarius]KRL31089.1 alpha-glucosidase, family 31 of glycosyl hydrolase [Companilactobacillus paralimentarius DSM 13238 = JCM 10415]QFR70547.1 alpha-xylosidase [Companilactobacillus paralimentarius]